MRSMRRSSESCDTLLGLSEYLYHLEKLERVFMLFMLLKLLLFVLKHLAKHSARLEL